MVDGEVDLDSGVADEVEGVTADKTRSMLMRKDLKTVADEIGGMPMGRRTVGFPS